jgi:cytochrome c peroxidase
MFSSKRPLLQISSLLLIAACVDAPLDVQNPLHSANGLAAVRADDGLPFSEEMAHLGDLIFDDVDLSLNRNQGCNACHSADWGFTGPDSDTNARGAVYEGSIPGAFGDRKPPSSAYATPAPIFHFSRQGGGQFVGGNFWDGRATGDRLGNPAADQAQGPFLNPAEQALRDEACVVYRVAVASYGTLYRQMWGSGIDDIAFPASIDDLCSLQGDRLPIDAVNRARIEHEYANIAIAIAVYEKSHEQFTSKFDAARKGMYRFTAEEQRGFALFQGRAKCSKCHPSGGQQPLFTDYSYDNLGVPANPENPALLRDPSFVDDGLGGFLLHTEWAPMAAGERGKMKVPTLRNVDLRPYDGAVKAYMHNGVFKSLHEVVHFYNTRDALGPPCTPSVPRSEWGATCWPAAEVPDNVNTSELGNLKLTQAEEDAIVAFLKTLSDGFIGGRRNMR